MNVEIQIEVEEMRKEILDLILMLTKRVLAIHERVKVLEAEAEKDASAKPD